MEVLAQRRHLFLVVCCLDDVLVRTFLLRRYSVHRLLVLLVRFCGLVVQNDRLDSKKGSTAGKITISLAGLTTLPANSAGHSRFEPSSVGVARIHAEMFVVDLIAEESLDILGVAIGDLAGNRQVLVFFLAQPAKPVGID